MHLIAATPGAIQDGAPAVDPGQTPAEVVVISAADSDLAALAEARGAMEDPPTLRLMPLGLLGHPVSVDLHLSDCATRSGLVIVRILGGAGYWRYGLAQYSARLAEAGVPLALLPGDDKPDPELQALSTVAPADHAALWAYLVEGGPANAAGFLALARALVRGEDRPAPARPLVKAGLYWPGLDAPGLDQVLAQAGPGAAAVPIVFYRSLLMGGGLDPVNRLIRALLHRGLAPVPVFVPSLKDPLGAALLEQVMHRAPPAVILNLTAFAVATPEGGGGDNPLAGPAANQAPVLQVVLAGSSEQAWAEGTRGLSPTDIAMNVALPEVDGRILSRAISFKDATLEDAETQCRIAAHRARADRVAFVADLTAAWARLRARAPGERKVAVILANYPNRDGRLANGVGLDTPASAVAILQALAGAGYQVSGAPPTPQALMERLMAGPTNWLTDRADRQGGQVLALPDYRRWLSAQPWEAKQALADRWGPPETDPFLGPEGFALGLHPFGNVVIGLQPARGYNIDPAETYHAPDLVPPHNYLAFYAWLRAWGADAVIHLGKHGNLEWLPGKALALSAACWPEIALGPVPHLYPFIVNDPGEGAQAKRRSAAVIVDHLTPPMTRAESYGPLKELEVLMDELAEAQGVDPRRARLLADQVSGLAQTTGIAADAGAALGDLRRLDAWLCEVKEAQIRDGLHVFGLSPEGVQSRDLALALARVPRGDGRGANASLLRALADDLGLGFDPLSADLGAPWEGPRPACLETPVLAAAAAPAGQPPSVPGPWRTTGDTVERLELFSQSLLAGAPPPGPASAAVLADLDTRLLPAITACGPAEMAALLTGLEGRAVPPGPSGAPTRGRPEVLPTGRNFYSVDTRALPTQTAWRLGRASADLLVERHLQDQGDWPRAMLLTAWGTACMRTGGDDVAQGLALMGVQPTWEAATGRVTGFQILPLALLGRPRVDVTLRVSGFFRDAFPGLVALFDSAARAVQALDEPEDQNPAAARARAGQGQARVYGSRPGAYGAGLQAMIDERLWATPADLGRAYMDWGQWAYRAGAEGEQDRAGLEQRLSQIQAVVQNQDNREHDLLDSDDYYQFEGGATAAVTHLRGSAPRVYHNDHSRPERPVIRTLEQELARVVRSRVVNPKWIEGVKRHGYKGAFEIAATVDYLFAFAATTGAVAQHHFDLVEQAFLDDDATRDFIATHNPPALADIADRLAEAVERGLWQPRSNSARARIDRFRRR